MVSAAWEGAEKGESLEFSIRPRHAAARLRAARQSPAPRPSRAAVRGASLVPLGSVPCGFPTPPPG